MVRGPLKLADLWNRSFSRKVDTNIKHSFYDVFYIKLSLKMYSFLNIKCTLIISHYLTKTFSVSMTISTPLSNIVFCFILFCFVCFVFVFCLIVKDDEMHINYWICKHSLLFYSAGYKCTKRIRRLKFTIQIEFRKTVLCQTQYAHEWKTFLTEQKSIWRFFSFIN